MRCGREARDCRAAWEGEEVGGGEAGCLRRVFVRMYAFVLFGLPCAFELSKRCRKQSNDQSLKHWLEQRLNYALVVKIWTTSAHTVGTPLKPPLRVLFANARGPVENDLLLQTSAAKRLCIAACAAGRTAVLLTYSFATTTSSSEWT